MGNYNFELTQDVISNDSINKYEEYINPGMARLIRLMGLDKLEVRANGCWVEDINGQRYLDCLGGFGIFNLGHRHPKVIEAVKEQLDMMPMSSKLLLSQPMINLAEVLAMITPGDLTCSFFCNSGAEAVEGAIKLARLYKNKPGIISTHNAFHGKTIGALSATGRDFFRKPCEPLLDNFRHVSFGDYKALDKAIDNETAAFIVEPIQGEGGVNLPPEGYFKRVREICDNHDILLIFDEVQTGLGRLGSMFGAEHFGVVPDLMTLAKALGGGVIPIGAVIGKKEIWSVFDENPLIHTSTFGGNPLACIAAISTIRVIMEEGLVENARIVGDKLIKDLQKLALSYPNIIKEIRGQGLLIGIEFTDEGYGGFIINELINRGIIVGYTLNNSKVLRIEPPLIIKPEEVDFLMGSLTEAVVLANNILGNLKVD